MPVPPDFSEIYRNNYRMVLNFFLTKGLPIETAKELTQDTFLNALKNLESYASKAAISTWLFKIALNIWRNYIRNIKTQKRNAEEVSLGDNGDSESPVFLTEANQESDIIDRETKEALTKGMGALPTQMQRCMILRIQRGMKYKDIAILMNLSIETVKSLIYQAKNRLKENFEKNYSPDKIPLRGDNG